MAGVYVDRDGILSALFWAFPKQEVRDELKKHGWKCSRAQECWRHTNNEKSREWIDNYLNQFAEKEEDYSEEWDGASDPTTSLHNTESDDGFSLTSQTEEEARQEAVARKKELDAENRQAAEAREAEDKAQIAKSTAQKVERSVDEFSLTDDTIP